MSTSTATAQEEDRASIEILAEVVEGLEGPATTQSAGVTATGSAATQNTATATAQQLVQMSNAGTLTAADTSMASIAPRADSQQDPSALVTVTVIGPDGNVTNKQISTDTPMDVFGKLVGREVAMLDTATATEKTRRDVLMRSRGHYYFYVQVCACSL